MMNSTAKSIGLDLSLIKGHWKLINIMTIDMPRVPEKMENHFRNVYVDGLF